MKRQQQQTTPYVFKLRDRFRVNHPFHPLYNQQFELVNYHRGFGSAYVDYCTESGGSGSIALEWTDLGEADPFCELAAGRSHFRVEELLRLVELLGGLALV